MEQEAKHLKYFKVENFKCFESFEMEDIGQFNLIVGDNNVGKTSVLEALSIDDNIDTTLSNLSMFINQRLNINNERGADDFNYLQFYFNQSQNNKVIKYSIVDTKIRKLNIELKYSTIFNLSNEEKNKLSFATLSTRKLKNVASIYVDGKFISNRFLNDFEFEKRYHPFIAFNMTYGDDLIEYYSQNIQESLDAKTTFIENIRLFINEIDDIEISHYELKNLPIVKIRLNNLDGLIPLPMFGEGSIKLFRILSQIIAIKNKKLMIDEIENGIHYSRFKNYIKIILTSAQKNNVQLFMTTHSLECMKYFKEALAELGENFQKEARHFLLKKLNNGNVKSYSFDFSQFENALEVGNEIRN